MFSRVYGVLRLHVAGVGAIAIVLYLIASLLLVALSKAAHPVTGDLPSSFRRFPMTVPPDERAVFTIEGVRDGLSFPISRSWYSH